MDKQSITSGRAAHALEWTIMRPCQNDLPVLSR